MKDFGPKYDSEIPEGHRTADESNRFLEDRRLRAQGFKLFSRMKNGEAVWVRNGQLYTQAEALEMLA